MIFAICNNTISTINTISIISLIKGEEGKLYMTKITLSKKRLTCLCNGTNNILLGREIICPK